MSKDKRIKYKVTNSTELSIAPFGIHTLRLLSGSVVSVLSVETLPGLNGFSKLLGCISHPFLSYVLHVKGGGA